MPWKDPAKKAEALRKYRADHPDYDMSWYYRHFEDASASRKRWKKANPEAVRAMSRSYRKRHPEAKRAQEARRRARKRGAKGPNDLTHDQWVEIQETQDHRCYYCGKRRKGKLTQDHLTPLSKGGPHTLHNVIAACSSCNSSRGNRAVLKPVQPLLLTVAPAKKHKAS